MVKLTLCHFKPILITTIWDSEIFFSISAEYFIVSNYSETLPWNGLILRDLKVCLYVHDKNCVTVYLASVGSGMKKNGPLKSYH